MITSRRYIPACIWAIALTVFIVGLPIAPVQAENTYWSDWPYHLLHRELQVITTTAYLQLPYPGSGDHWETALDSAIEDMDGTNLTASYASGQSTGVVYVRVERHAQPNLTLATTSYYSEKVVPPGLRVAIDCKKNHWLQSEPKCTAEENLVTRAKIEVNPMHPFWNEGGSVEKGVVVEDEYSIRRRTMTHELTHVPGKHHADCSLSSVMKQGTKDHWCQGQREMTSHDIGWVNTRYPLP